MVDISSLNTLRTPVSAQSLLDINTLEDLKKLDATQKFMFLGEGANVLFTKDFDGTIIKINLKGKKNVSETDKDVIIEVAAGEDWHNLVMWTVEQGWSGMENMALIPGTAGAAVVGNIAAYGQNQGELVEKVEVVDISSGEKRYFPNAECQFVYRKSFFSDNKDYLVTKVWYKLSKLAKFDVGYHSRYESLAAELTALSKTPPYTPLDIAQAVISLRKRKQPDWTKVGTAGSFFKNPFVTKTKLSELQSRIPELQAYPTEKMLYPTQDDPLIQQADLVKIPAGRLLDFLGWKSKTIDHVSTHPTHALSVINLGGATGQEIYDYAENMRADIKKHFDVDLEYEIKVIS